MIRHALVQFKPHKSRFEDNLARLAGMLAHLQAELDTQNTAPVDVICLPETALTGYFLQAGVREQALEASVLFDYLQDVLNRAGWQRPVDICLGFYERDGGSFHNSALYAEFNTASAGIKHVHRKMFLPTYGVFDEQRYVSRGHGLDAFKTRFGTVGMLICEDAWHASCAAVLALKGAMILYIPMASPARDFNTHPDLATNKPANALRWQRTAEGIAAEHGTYVLTTSLTGFEGGKGFTGASHAIDPYGELIAEGELFDEHILVTDVHLETIQVARYESPLLADLRANLPELIRAFAEVSNIEVPST
jgi:predicted amidohydrolase